MKALEKRALIIDSLRDFFKKKDYLEVDTPLRLPVIIPEAHIDSIRSDEWFLQASPELCMKRLVSRGYGRIFQICKCFRKNERGEKHLPELTMLEWYAEHETYIDLMNTCQDLIRFIAEKTGQVNNFLYQGKSINLKKEFTRISVKNSFLKYSDTSMEKALRNGDFDKIMSFEIEPNLGLDSPVFLYDYPAASGSLAKLKKTDPDFAERFELYIAGIELANGFTELIDAEEQKKRFTKELDLRKKMGKKALPLPEKFLSDLQNMPDTAGIALGVDRLVMLFCDLSSIDQAVTFTPEEL